MHYLSELHYIPNCFTILYMILNEWCQINKLTINYEKTSYIIFKNYQNKFQFDLELTINQ